MTGGIVRRGRHYLERDGRPILPVGAHLVPPEGPDWPWRGGAEPLREAFVAMRAARPRHRSHRPALVRHRAGAGPLRREAPGAARRAPARRPGRLASRCIRRSSSVARSATPSGTRPGAPDAIRIATRRCCVLQAAHAGMLARRWRGDPSIIAWDLTDEPPFWVAPDTTDDDAGTSTQAIAGALRIGGSRAPRDHRHLQPGSRLGAVPRGCRRARRWTSAASIPIPSTSRRSTPTVC